MTTIACDGKMMAADGRMTLSGEILSECQQKLWRLNDGRIVGMTGPVELHEGIVEWLNAGAERDSFIDMGDEDGRGRFIVLDREGLILELESNGTFTKLKAPAAIGSCGKLATGVMLAGKDAFEAVRLACTRDSRSGGVCVFMRPTGE